MKRKQSKQLLLENLRLNPNLKARGMYIFGFGKDGIIRKRCTIERCISEVEKETPYGKHMIDLQHRILNQRVY